MRTLVRQRGTADPAPARFRERHRAARHRAFLDTARRIVTSEGHGALTMQRVTDEMGTSVGGIYLYFPTKDALLAELEAEALHVLHASCLLGQARLDAHLEVQGTDATTAALARAVATARFWIDAEASLPTEIDLSRRLFSDAGVVAGEEETARLLPAVLRLLDEARTRIGAAAALGALAPDDDLERAITAVSAVNGVLLASAVGSWDEELFDGRRLARRLVDVLFLGWGADGDGLDAANDALDAFGAREHLAPVPGPGPGPGPGPDVERGDTAADSADAADSA